MKKSFCFLSKKGGVGKTTFALNCAHALAFSQFRTLVIDMDGQANLTKHLLGDDALQGNGAKLTGDIAKVMALRMPMGNAIVQTEYENLDVLPGSTSLEDLPVFDSKILREPARFKTLLQPVLEQYDFIVIDCPPALNWLTRSVLFAADAVVVPIQAETYAIQGLRDLVPMLDRMTATAQLFKIVVNMYRSNTQLHQNICKEIMKEYPGRVAKQRVRLTIQLAEAAREGQCIFEYAPASIGAMDMYSLCWELFELSPDRVKLGAQNHTASELADQSESPLENSEASRTPAHEPAGLSESSDLGESPRSREMSDATEPSDPEESSCSPEPAVASSGAPSIVTVLASASPSVSREA